MFVALFGFTNYRHLCYLLFNFIILNNFTYSLILSNHILNFIILVSIIMLLDDYIYLSIIKLEINCINILFNSVAKFSYDIDAQCFANQ